MRPRAGGAGERTLVVVVAAAAAVLLRLPWWRADLEGLVRGVVPDDAFYYFQLARRLWAGQGLSFDGATLASGVHPLWLGLLVPLFRSAEPGSAAPVRLALAAGSGLALAATLQLERLARRLTGRVVVSLPLALAFGANLWVVRESLNGLETALTLALGAALLSAGAGALEQPSARAGWRFGLLGAASIWARSDSALIVACLGLAVLLVARPRGTALAGLAGPPAAAVAALVAATAALTGHPLQSSATAVPWLVHANWHRAHPGAGSWEAHRHGLELLEGSLLGSRDLLGPAASLVLLVSLLAAGALLLLARGRLSRATRAAAIVLGSLLLGLACLHAVHGYLRWYPRSWYFVGWALAAYVAAALAAAGLGEAMARSGWRGAAAWATSGLLLACCGLEHLRTWRLIGQPQFPWQAEMLAAGRGLAALVPPDQVVGSFNAAIIAYATPRTVVNLDGVVNEEAASALREGRLGRYLRERRVRYLVDYPVMWSDAPYLHAAGPYLGPEFVAASRQTLARFDVPGVGWPSPDQAVTLIRIAWP